ncbi:vhs domain-containing protein [Amylocarpus encephaloides]|uniref:Vhs domain-containing protein n=1 Tax=Amylocarpus encephaloides TaxID=45428 RepID=A0A9P8C3B4_9HELO|nr:vhs domain-containing protein [Amylocarpus encephaloides]
MSAFRSKKDYTAVTVAVESCTSDRYEEDDFSGIPELVEAIRLRDKTDIQRVFGTREAARALRKQLKYGNVHRQLRALNILDSLIQNAGPEFQGAIVDSMLLDRLKFCGTADLSDPLVRAKCEKLFRSWAKYKSVRGLEQISVLYKITNQRNVMDRDKSRAVRETENPFEADEEEGKSLPQQSHSRNTSLSHGQASGSSTPPRTSFFSPTHTVNSTVAASKAKKDKKSKKKRKLFNLEAEKETMKSCIADSSMASTNLMNTLKSINRECERISDNVGAVQSFENCKLLRRKLLRYIHHVEAEQWLGALLHANDEIVVALMTFEQLDGSLDADSDSDDEMAQQAHAYRMLTSNKDTSNDYSFSSNEMAGLYISPTAPIPKQHPPPPPRPSQRPPPPPPEEEKVEEEDENNPFADRNALDTPRIEKEEPRWRVV